MSGSEGLGSWHWVLSMYYCVRFSGVLNGPRRIIRTLFFLLMISDTQTSESDVHVQHRIQMLQLPMNWLIIEKPHEELDVKRNRLTYMFNIRYTCFRNYQLFDNRIISWGVQISDDCTSYKSEKNNSMYSAAGI